MVAVETRTILPLSELLDERRQTLGALIEEDDIALFFNKIVKFHVNSARQNNDPSKPVWLKYSECQADIEFYNEIKDLDQRGVYEFTQGRVEKELQRAEQELKALQTSKPPADSGLYENYDRRARGGQAILSRNHLNDETKQYIADSIRFFEAERDSTITASQKGRLAECEAKVEELTALRLKTQSRIEALATSKAKELVAA